MLSQPTPFLAKPGRSPWWALSLLGALVACSPSGAPPAAGGQGPGAGMPAPQVGVVTVQLGEVALQAELPGRLEASRVAQVRARAAGILQQRLFREGSDVQAGQALFLIDDAPYEVALSSAEAARARAVAALGNARALVERYRPLASEQAISQQDYTQALAAQQAAVADVAAASAAVQTARINLGYARVTAPIAGRIGRSLVTEGALVGQGEATPLAVIQQIDPLYVNVTQSATEAMRWQRALASGQLQPAGQGAVAVRVVLHDGSEHAQPGRLLFSDLTVDAGTGQVSLRAEVPNPGGALLPGLYVRVRMEQAVARDAVALPQQAVTRSAQGDTVKVVGADGLVETRPVTVGGQQAGRWVVQAGLKSGEQVVVDGVQKLAMLPPGTPVKAVPWTPPGAAAAATR
ncbi:MAG: efflux RND transporter periplasmic adaptor subunit [Hydrogenophaga sp.]